MILALLTTNNLFAPISSELRWACKQPPATTTVIIQFIAGLTKGLSGWQELLQSQSR